MTCLSNDLLKHAGNTHVGSEIQTFIWEVKSQRTLQEALLQMRGQKTLIRDFGKLGDGRRGGAGGKGPFPSSVVPLNYSFWVNSFSVGLL